MVDPHKIVMVKRWPKPMNPTNIQRFLGLARFYKRFVKGFSSIAIPLTKLT